MKRFIPALDMLRRAPEKMPREDFAEIYISKEDDRAMYHQVKSSMSEVYDLMSIQMTRIERQSTMGLIYDVMMFAIWKDQQVIASKVNWIHRAQGESEYYHKRNVDKYVAAMRMQVDAMAERSTGCDEEASSCWERKARQERQRQRQRQGSEQGQATSPQWGHHWH